MVRRIERFRIGKSSREVVGGSTRAIENVKGTVVISLIRNLTILISRAHLSDLVCGSSSSTTGYDPIHLQYLFLFCFLCKDKNLTKKKKNKNY